MCEGLIQLVGSWLWVCWRLPMMCRSPQLMPPPMLPAPTPGSVTPGGVVQSLTPSMHPEGPLNLVKRIPRFFPDSFSNTGCLLTIYWPCSKDCKVWHTYNKVKMGFVKKGRHFYHIHYIIVSVIFNIMKEFENSLIFPCHVLDKVPDFTHFFPNSLISPCRKFFPTKFPVFPGSGGWLTHTVHPKPHDHMALTSGVPMGPPSPDLLTSPDTLTLYWLLMSYFLNFLFNAVSASHIIQRDYKCCQIWSDWTSCQRQHFT